MSAEPRLHVEVEGSGPVVVLAHGFGGSARNFLPQARGLRDRYRIVRFDARGHARSEAPAEASAYTPEAFVADLGRVLDQVGARAAVVGGLSMGAGTALRFALAHPGRVQGRALAAALPQAKLVVVEDAGHVVNLAQPAAFNRALEEFLAAAAGGA